MEMMALSNSVRSSLQRSSLKMNQKLCKKEGKKTGNVTQIQQNKKKVTQKLLILFVLYRKQPSKIHKNIERYPFEKENLN